MMRLDSMGDNLMRYRIESQYGIAFHDAAQGGDNAPMHSRQVKDILAELMAADLDQRGKPISANQLAEKTGVPQPTITRILNGQSLDPDTETLRPLADYFKVTVGQMRGEDPLLRDPKIIRVITAMEQMNAYQKDTMVRLGDTITEPAPKVDDESDGTPEAKTG